MTHAPATAYLLLPADPFRTVPAPHIRVPSSLIAVAGAAGLGLVWGWWAVLLARGVRRPIVCAAALLAGSAAAAAVVRWFAGTPGTLAFAAAALAAAWVHLAWRQSLRSSTRIHP